MLMEDNSSLSIYENDCALHSAEIVERHQSQGREFTNDPATQGAGIRRRYALTTSFRSKL